MLAFTYSNASNSQLLHYQGLLIEVYSARPIKLKVTWLFRDRGIKGKSQKRIER